jgi:DNA replication protein DnaC
MTDESEIQIDDVILNCEIHGDYNQRSIDCLGKNIKFKECQQCTNIEKIENEKREAIQSDIFANQKRIDLSKLAGVSARYRHLTLNDIKPLDKPQELMLKAMSASAEAILSCKATPSLIITGGVGTGKTMMCSALLGSILNAKRGKIIKCIDMVRRLKSTWSRDSTESEEGIIKQFTTIPLLIIDEVGVQFGSDTEKMFIFDIIDGRYENILPTILISNLDIEAIKALIGERVIDRLRQDGGKLLALDGRSSRK